MGAIPTAEEIGYPVRVHWAADSQGARKQMRAPRDLLWFVVHDTEGTDSEGILTSPAEPVASAHALIARDGSLVYMVPLDVTAWTPGNDYVARLSVNVELEGFVASGYTEAQYRSLAAFYGWCRGQGMVNVPPEYVGREERAGLCGHQDVANPYRPGAWGGAAGHTDPGPLFDWARLAALIAAQDSRAATTETDAMRYFPETGHSVGGGFLAFWRARGGLEIFGYPLTEEIQEDGRTVQYFERARFEYHPDEPETVQLGRIGAELLEARGGHAS